MYTKIAFNVSSGCYFRFQVLQPFGNFLHFIITHNLHLRGGLICNETPFITPATNTLGFYAICQTKDQSVAVIMVHGTLFRLSKFNKLQTF